MATSAVSQYQTESAGIEVVFANALKGFQLSTEKNPFDIITGFKIACAERALDIGANLEGDTISETFANWDLETKLWNLVELLYSFRLDDQFEPVKEYEFSSLGTKQENFLRKNPKIRELSIIIDWLQINSRATDSSDIEEYQLKWKNTRLAVVNKDYDILVNSKNLNADQFVDSLDVDAPLRSNKSIHPTDDSTDSKNFLIIYKLLISNNIEEAIEVANKTGNYALSLILLGAIQDYYDPIIDKQDDTEEVAPKASGIKHKLLWKKTVYKLSQYSHLNKYEKLIYNYLSGGDISHNLKQSDDSWEESLLLYLSQLFSYNVEKFVESALKSDNESLAINIPKPQLSSIDEILNALSKSSNTVSEQSRHPLRVIAGSIMINQVSSLLHNLINSHAQNEIALRQPYLTRVITHLSIFHSIIGGNDPIITQDITTIITLYVSQLADLKLTELIPIYLSFIPDEKDARETYSLFLSTITDYDERSKQMEISKKINSQQFPIEESSSDLMLIENIDNGDGTNINSEDKLVNVLKRTVERVMAETEQYYTDLKSSNTIEVQESSDQVDETDFKLYRSVEYFYENNMHEDAITASIIIIRRFLLCGKLSTLKKFAEGKSFKALVNDYDLQLQTRKLAKDTNDEVGNITEDNKLELLEYSSLLEGLNLIDDWKKFVNITNGTGKWASSAVSNSIEKTSKTLNKLIFNWFKDLSQSTVNVQDKAIFEEYRNIYVPYLIIELLEICQNGRLNDWQYMRLVFKLINEVANENENDFLICFQNSGRLDEFLVKAGELSVIASEKGIKGVFY
ncbi:nuclear pore protein 84/107 [Scheffersomyces coipomensis]|uniref:nuclear pore protein 84/107 n=1 Tax=Scheffersomyces coipomensis TaxID=1788519 RepID=UPI00315C614D